MDAYEATRVVFSRIQALDPENAAKIMGLLLLQDHGEKEMIRLAFGPEPLLHSVLAKARKDLALLPPSPAAAAPQPPFLLSRHNSSSSSSSRLLAAGGGIPPPLNVASASWAPPPAFSRSSSSGGSANGVADDINSPDELMVSPGNRPPSSPFHGAGDLIDELQLHDQLSFFNDPAAGARAGDLFYPEECRSPSGGGDGAFFPYGMGWGVNGHHRRSCSAAADLYLGSDAAGAGLGWRPCLYFARGYCKNGSTCRFLHGLPDDAASAMAASSGIDVLVEQQCQELLLRSKSPRLGGASQFMASAAAFPYSPTGSLPLSPSSRCMSFLQSDNQRAAAAAAAAALMLGGDDAHKFMGRARIERNDFAGMLNPGSRQIYLTFPADSTFREEDVSNYFSIYGPVQDVRIPYQQKRMFGFVTFVFSETVKLILAKGNPHFVCDARVLVKPYKEKGKVPDKYRRQQQQADRGDCSGCSTPTGLDVRDHPFDLQHLGARMLYSGSEEALLRRKLEEQQQATELQQAIELQGRRLMGLQLLDLRNLSLSSPTATNAAVHTNPGSIAPPIVTTTTTTTTSSDGRSSPPEDKSASPACGAMNGLSQAAAEQQLTVNAGADKEESGVESSPNEDSDIQESAAHNLPDSPFASPTRASFVAHSFTVDNPVAPHIISGNSNSNSNSRLMASALLPPTSSFNSCFFPMPRLSDHGAIGM